MDLYQHKGRKAGSSHRRFRCQAVKIKEKPKTPFDAPKDPKGKEPDATVVEGADGSTDEDEESVAFDKQLKDRLWDANDPDLTAMEHFHPQALPHLNLDQVFLFRCILYFAMASGCRINDDTCPMQI